MKIISSNILFDIASAASTHVSDPHTEIKYQSYDITQAERTRRKQMCEASYFPSSTSAMKFLFNFSSADVAMVEKATTRTESLQFSLNSSGRRVLKGFSMAFETPTEP